MHMCSPAIYDIESVHVSTRKLFLRKWFKDNYTPTKLKFLKVLFYCYIHQLTYPNTIFGRLKQLFSCFITPYLRHYFVILWNRALRGIHT